MDFIFLFLKISIILSPFVFVFLGQNKTKGLVYSVTLFFSLHFLTGFATQYLNIFTNNYVTFIFLFFIIILFILSFFILKIKSQKIIISPLFLFVFLCIGIQLWSIHYNYTGSVQSLHGTTYVESDFYGYPLYSDEWIIASLAKYSIENNKLPFVNPFVEDSFFLNFLFAFPVFVSNIFIILQIDPVANFALIPILLGIIIFLVVFSLLRTYGISRYVSLITIVFIPFITQSGSLTGIWNAIPYTVGFIFVILFLIGIHIKNKYISILSSFLAVLFYPPIIIIVAPLIIFALLKHKAKYLISLFILCAPLLFFPEINSRIIRDNLDNGMFAFNVLNIVPIILTPFIVVGFFVLYKKRIFPLIITVTVGCVFWIYYSFYSKVIFIEHVRIVAITSILLVIVAGFGIQLFEKHIIHFIPKTLLILILLYVTYTYPLNDKWIFLVMEPFQDSPTRHTQTSAPITRHLLPDDITLFNSLSKQIFIAPPWKGLVLGSVTNNQPLQTKNSTISTSILLYKDFIHASCDKKREYINQYDIQYIYGPHLDCDNFVYIGESSEKLKLYKVISQN